MFTFLDSLMEEFTKVQLVTVTREIDVQGCQLGDDLFSILGHLRYMYYWISGYLLFANLGPNQAISHLSFSETRAVPYYRKLIMHFINAILQNSHLFNVS